MELEEELLVVREEKKVLREHLAQRDWPAQGSHKSYLPPSSDRW